jgi:hypothetical protein
MPFSNAQRTRLGVEKAILEAYFPDDRSRWINPTASNGVAEVEVDVVTNSKKYSLKIIIPMDFPNSCPTLLVSKPSCELKKRNGSMVSGGEDHSWGSFNGCTKICHHRPQQWTSDLTMYQVFMKGLIWLEAYEAHLRTEKPIHNFLREM